MSPGPKGKGKGMLIAVGAATLLGMVGVGVVLNDDTREEEERVRLAQEKKEAAQKKAEEEEAEAARKKAEAALVEGVLGWMGINRDRIAVATYRVQSPPGESMVAIIAKEAEMMKSEEVLNPVISNLDLVSRWKLDSDLEALAQLRSKLSVKQDGNRVRVIYRDRSQDRALEILRAINEGFAKERNAATARQTMPPVIPLDAPNP